MSLWKTRPHSWVISPSVPRAVAMNGREDLVVAVVVVAEIVAEIGVGISVGEVEDMGLESGEQMRITDSLTMEEANERSKSSGNGRSHKGLG